jgi:hypothetical protein
VGHLLSALYITPPSLNMTVPMQGLLNDFQTPLQQERDRANLPYRANVIFFLLVILVFKV